MRRESHGKREIRSTSLAFSHSSLLQRFRARHGVSEEEDDDEISQPGHEPVDGPPAMAAGAAAGSQGRSRRQRRVEATARAHLSRDWNQHVTLTPLRGPSLGGEVGGGGMGGGPGQAAFAGSVITCVKSWGSVVFCTGTETIAERRLS